MLAANLQVGTAVFSWTTGVATTALIQEEKKSKSECFPQILMFFKLLQHLSTNNLWLNREVVLQPKWNHNSDRRDIVFSIPVLWGSGGGMTQ